MAQTEIGWPVSLSLSANNRAETKEQSAARSALSLASCRRSGRSPAWPYPPHECQESTISDHSPLAKGTFLLCIDRNRKPRIILRRARFDIGELVESLPGYPEWQA